MTVDSISITAPTVPLLSAATFDHLPSHNTRNSISHAHMQTIPTTDKCHTPPHALYDFDVHQRPKIATSKLTPHHPSIYPTPCPSPPRRHPPCFKITCSTPGHPTTPLPVPLPAPSAVPRSVLLLTSARTTVASRTNHHGTPPPPPFPPPHQQPPHMSSRPPHRLPPVSRAP